MTPQQTHGAGAAHVVYAPFRRMLDFSTCVLAWKLPSGYQERTSASLPKPPLSIVQTGTVLTLVCHSDPLGNAINDGGQEVLTLTQLVTRLGQDGLKPGLQKLRFCALKGGANGTGIFAKALQGALRKAGHPSLTVTSFVGGTPVVLPVSLDTFESAPVSRPGMPSLR